jgi:CubicO group peptidase (beta-lactamase class C family)
MIVAVSGSAAQAQPAAVQEAVSRHFGAGQSDEQLLWRPGYPGGAIVIVVTPPRTPYFFTYGCAVGTQETDQGSCQVGTEGENAAPMSLTSGFNLASVGKLFTALILAHTTQMSVNDSPSKYMADLTGACIKSKTLGQIVSQSSGLPAYPDSQACPHPPKGQPYDYPTYIANLNCWGHSTNSCPPVPPQPAFYLYSNDGFMLLRLVLAKSLNTPFPSLVGEFAWAAQMNQTSMPIGQLPASAVQGYSCYDPPESEEGVESGCDGHPVSAQDELKNTFYQDNDGNGGQVWSTAKDMPVFAELALGQPVNVSLGWPQAMTATEQILFKGCGKTARSCTAPYPYQVGMAWQLSTQNGTTILGKNGGVPFSSTYIGLVPHKLAVVVLVNRGQVDAAKAGQQILGELASQF